MDGLSFYNKLEIIPPPQLSFKLCCRNPGKKLFLMLVDETYYTVSIYLSADLRSVTHDVYRIIMFKFSCNCKFN